MTNWMRSLILFSKMDYLEITGCGGL